LVGLFVTANVQQGYTGYFVDTYSPSKNTFVSTTVASIYCVVIVGFSYIAISVNVTNKYLFATVAVITGITFYGLMLWLPPFAVSANAPISEPPWRLAGHALLALRRTLSAFDLLALGIGAIIGAGIFVLTGQAAAANAGPAIALSFVLGAFVCGFAGLCYAEMASTVPIAGSAYT
jgi:amino acid permease